MFKVDGGYSIPDFRMTNERYFRIVDACLFGENEFMESQKGKGVILMGRRRWGKTAAMLSCAYSAAFHFPGSQIGLTSKTETDIQDMLNIHLKGCIYQLPPELRLTSSANDNKRELFFGNRYKDKDGNNNVVGNRSRIYAKSPDPKSFEGYGQRMFIIDEAGKSDVLADILSKVFPSLNGNDGITRMGVPLIGGTASKEDEMGLDYQNLWYNAESYKMLRYFVAGHTGIMVDECGEDKTLEALKWILNERIVQKQKSESEYYDFIIQYPLTPEEAFLSGGESPFDLVLLSAREAQLLNAEMIGDNPIGRGYFMWVGKPYESDVRWIPSEHGKGQMYMNEQPKEDCRVFVAGCDPTDGAADLEKSSKLSFFVKKCMPITDEDEIRNGPVFQYTDKPADMYEAYEQCLMACIYYDTQVLIENNKRLMIEFFKNKGFKHLLRKRPKSASKESKGSRSVIEYGFYMDEQMKKDVINYIDSDIKRNIHDYNFKDLVQDLKVHKPDVKRKKKDRVDGWGATLLCERSMKEGELYVGEQYRKTIAEEKPKHNDIKGLALRKNKQGKLTK